MDAGVPVTLKTCSRCNEGKGLDEFNRYVSSRDGRQNYCRDCAHAYRKAPERMAAEREREKSPRRRAYKDSRAKAPAGRAASNRRAATYRERHAEDIAAKRQTDEWRGYQRKWRAEHQEAIRAYRRIYQRAYRQTPKYKAYLHARRQTPEYKAAERARRQTPAYQAYMRTYRETHRVAIRAYMRTYERAYRETPKRKAYELARRQDPEYQARQREYSRVYEQTHKEARRARQRTPEQRMHHRIRAHKRRALGPIPAGWWETRLAAQRGRCCYCNKRLNQTTRKATVEHITPVSKGGNNGVHNLAIACKSCNSRRGNRAPLAPVSGLLVP